MTDFILPLFFTMFGLAIVWLILVVLLFRSLAKNFPAMPAQKHWQVTFAVLSPRPDCRIAYSYSSHSQTRVAWTCNLVRANVMRLLLVVYLLGFGSARLPSFVAR